MSVRMYVCMYVFMHVCIMTGCGGGWEACWGVDAWSLLGGLASERQAWSMSNVYKPLYKSLICLWSVGPQPTHHSLAYFANVAGPGP